MVRLTINNKQVEVPEGTSILDAAASVGVQIPTLCYLKDINEIGACRLCMVECEGQDMLLAACNNEVQEGMNIKTNSPRVRSARKMNMELILSQHDFSCATCIKSSNCSLQKLARQLNTSSVPYKRTVEPEDWNREFPLIRHASRCIKCMRCIQICGNVQTLGIWDVENTGGQTTVAVSGVRKIEESECVLCGQCVTHCPVGALHGRDDTEKVFEALEDPEKITVVQIAPAVRAAWGEGINLKKEQATVKRLVGVLRQMGFDYIFDTDFGADLTIMEEGSEFLERLPKIKEEKRPMFTSCCPGWVRFLKTQYPDMVKNLSSVKSPQQMFGAVAKTYFAKSIGVDPDKIFSLSIMPCISKKQECDIPTINNAGSGKDVDAVITTRELDRMILREFINAADVKEEEFDSQLGVSSGAGVIFGASGGVMEAALRTAYKLVTGNNPDLESFEDVRGVDGWKEAVYNLAGQEIKVAVVSGLGNARKMIQAIRKGTACYDIVEVMSCPGGCVGGGGQPSKDGQELAERRGNSLYGLDQASEVRFSHENPEIIKLYNEFLEKPLSHKAHELLHIDHESWQISVRNWY